MRIDGRPAGFAGGKPELLWKRALESALPPVAPGGDIRGLRLAFTLPPVAPGGPGADLDNLLDPVLSVLVNRLGWFGGRRGGIDFIFATKSRDGPSGCEVDLLAERLEPPILGRRILEAVYAGSLPRSARDEAMAAWVRNHLLIAEPSPSPHFGVSLSFGDPRTNLGEVATGRSKPVIDCLWPAIGGRPGAPSDHLVTDLRLDRSGVSAGEVRIVVWEA